MFPPKLTHAEATPEASIDRAAQWYLIPAVLPETITAAVVPEGTMGLSKKTVPKV